MGGWALIIEPDEGRAAQYGYLVEQRKLVPTVARGAADALFHVNRLGPPQLIIAEAALPAEDGLALLRNLRAIAPAASSPAVLIVEGRQTEAARRMIELGIIAILPRRHAMSSMLAAIDRAMGQQPAGGAEAEVQHLQHLSALQIAEKLAEDPLVDELAKLPVIEGAIGDESLQLLVETTASAFGTSIAALWIDRWDLSGRSWFKLHQGSNIRSAGMPAHWAAVRSAAGTQPLHVPDVARHPVLSRNPIAAMGVLGSFAAAPLIGADGLSFGAVAIVEPVGGKVDAALLEPLVFWSQRVAGELESRRLVSKPPEPAARFQSSTVPARVALEAAVASLKSAILVTDADGVVCFANRALAPLLRLDSVRVIGLRRTDALAVLRTGAGADEEVVRTIADAPPDVPAQLDFEVRRPQRRVLRWRCDVVQLGPTPGRLDEFRDITREVKQREALERIDALTGLANRRGAVETLGREVGRALRLGEHFSLVLFEVDGLARLDRPLVEPTFRAVAWVLRDTLRTYDQLFRHAEDQLLACLPSALHDAALAFGLRACHAVEKTQVEGVPRVTISGGVAQFDPAHPLEETLAQAAHRLAEAKAAGGNRVG